MQSELKKYFKKNTAIFTVSINDAPFRLACLDKEVQLEQLVSSVKLLSAIKRNEYGRFTMGKADSTQDLNSSQESSRRNFLETYCLGLDYLFIDGATKVLGVGANYNSTDFEKTIGVFIDSLEQIELIESVKCSEDKNTKKKEILSILTQRTVVLEGT